MKIRLKICLLTFVLVITCVILPEDIVVSHGFWLYLIQFTFILVNVWTTKHNYLSFLSPSFLTLSYLCLSYFFGHYAIANGIGINFRYHDQFYNYSSLTFITSFFLLCNLCVFLPMSFNAYAKLGRLHNLSYQRSIGRYKLFLLFSLLLFLGFVKIDLSLIGGGGDFSYAFKLAVSILIVILLNSFNVRWKYLYYLFILFFFLIGHYESKREILYVLILILSVELIKNGTVIRLNLRYTTYFLIGGILIFYMIIVSSIMRGYGNYQVDNPFDASKFVLEYVQSDYAADALAANFELSSVYGNTSNAVDYVYKGDVDYLYGVTFIKFLFLPVPRSIFPDKPPSMIDIYTQKFAPEFREVGGSYPIGVYAEGFWNFSVFVFPFLFLLYFVFNMLFINVVFMIKNSVVTGYSLFLIFMYVTLIQFVRGSGFEIWLLYGLLAWCFSVVVIAIFKLRRAVRVTAANGVIIPQFK